MGSSLEFFTPWISFYNLTPCRMCFGNCSRHFQTFRLDFPPFWNMFLPLILWYYTFLVSLFLNGLSHLFELIFLYLIFKLFAFLKIQCFSPVTIRSSWQVSPVSRSSVSSFVWLSSWQLQPRALLTSRPIYLTVYLIFLYLDFMRILQIRQVYN